MLQELIEADFSGRISARWSQHTDARTAHRNGHREKTLATQAGGAGPGRLETARRQLLPQPAGRPFQQSYIPHYSVSD
ncbi:transposase [Streptomyces sp. HUAS TT20]|nr:transposase [Streptomyces sp. HUAS 15-9]UXY32226.1 transposase [Streptomyces sp. HUAS 15-9]